MTAPTPTMSMEDDLASLVRVRDRLSSTPDTALPRILTNLLPRFLERLQRYTMRMNVCSSVAVATDEQQRATVAQERIRSLFLPELAGIVSNAIIRVEGDISMAVPWVETVAEFVSSSCSMQSTKLDGTGEEQSEGEEDSSLCLARGIALTFALKLLSVALPRCTVNSRTKDMNTKNTTFQTENPSVHSPLSAALKAVNFLDHQQNANIHEGGNQTNPPTATSRDDQSIRNNLHMASWICIDAISVLTHTRPLLPPDISTIVDYEYHHEAFAEATSDNSVLSSFSILALPDESRASSSSTNENDSFGVFHMFLNILLSSLPDEQAHGGLSPLGQELLRYRADKFPRDPRGRSSFGSAMLANVKLACLRFAVWPPGEGLFFHNVVAEGGEEGEARSVVGERGGGKPEGSASPSPSAMALESVGFRRALILVILAACGASGQPRQKEEARRYLHAYRTMLHSQEEDGKKKKQKKDVISRVAMKGRSLQKSNPCLLACNVGVTTCHLSSACVLMMLIVGERNAAHIVDKFADQRHLWEDVLGRRTATAVAVCRELREPLSPSLSGAVVDFLHTDIFELCINQLQSKDNNGNKHDFDSEVELLLSLVVAVARRALGMAAEGGCYHHQLTPSWVEVTTAFLLQVMTFYCTSTKAESLPPWISSCCREYFHLAVSFLCEATGFPTRSIPEMRRWRQGKVQATTDKAIENARLICYQTISSLSEYVDFRLDSGCDSTEKGHRKFSLDDCLLLFSLLSREDNRGKQEVLKTLAAIRRNVEIVAHVMEAPVTSAEVSTRCQSSLADMDDEGSTVTNEFSVMVSHARSGLPTQLLQELVIAASSCSEAVRMECACWVSDIVSFVDPKFCRFLCSFLSSDRDSTISGISIRCLEALSAKQAMSVVTPDVYRSCLFNFACQILMTFVGFEKAMTILQRYGPEFGGIISSSDGAKQGKPVPILSSSNIVALFEASFVTPYFDNLGGDCNQMELQMLADLLVEASTHSLRSMQDLGNAASHGGGGMGVDENEAHEEQHVSLVIQTHNMPYGAAGAYMAHMFFTRLSASSCEGFPWIKGRCESYLHKITSFLAQVRRLPPHSTRTICYHTIAALSEYICPYEDVNGEEGHRELSFATPILLFELIERNKRERNVGALALESIAHAYENAAAMAVYRCPSRITGVEVNSDAIVQNAAPLLPTLLSAACSESHIMRYAGASWASRVLRSVDPAASHFLCTYLAADPDVKTSMIAKNGLVTAQHGNTSKDEFGPNYSVGKSAVRFLDSLNASDQEILLASLDCKAAEIANKLKISRNAAYMVLRCFKYSTGKALDAATADPSGILERCGLESRGNCLQDWVESRGSEVVKPADMCAICFEFGIYPENMYAMPCHHAFCLECWRSYLLTRFQEGASSILDTVCPHPKCRERVTLTEVSAIVPDYVEGWKRKYLESMVTLDLSHRWCPGSDCSMIAILDETPRTKSAKCEKCDTKFCFKCGLEPHHPAECNDVVKWNKFAKDSKTWIIQHTKPCPNCNAPIEKNDGCNHMHCLQCDGHFCWLCMRLFNVDEVYDHACNRPADDASGDDRRKVFFLERFQAHAESETHAKRNFDNAADFIRKIEGWHILSADEVDIIVDAKKTVIECRQFLKYSFVAAYYMAVDAKARELFESYQATLEQFAERLSALTESKMDETCTSGMLSVHIRANALHTLAARNYIERMLSYVDKLTLSIENTKG